MARIKKLVVLLMEESIVQMKMSVGRDVNVRRMNAVAVSILRAYAVTGVRRRKFVQKWENAKKSWTDVINV